MREIIKMATKPGFLEVWWDRFRKKRKSGEKDSPVQIYETMEAEYEEQYGLACFPSWEAFRKYKNRHK